MGTTEGGHVTRFQYSYLRILMDREARRARVQGARKELTELSD